MPATSLIRHEVENYCSQITVDQPGNNSHCSQPTCRRLVSSMKHCVLCWCVEQCNEAAYVGEASFVGKWLIQPKQRWKRYFPLPVPDVRVGTMLVANILRYCLLHFRNQIRGQRLWLLGWKWPTISCTKFPIEVGLSQNTVINIWVWEQICSW